MMRLEVQLLNGRCAEFIQKEDANVQTEEDGVGMKEVSEEGSKAGGGLKERRQKGSTPPPSGGTGTQKVFPAADRCRVAFQRTPFLLSETHGAQVKRQYSQRRTPDSVPACACMPQPRACAPALILAHKRIQDPSPTRHDHYFPQCNGSWVQSARSLGLASARADHQGLGSDALGHAAAFGIIHLKYYATALANSFPLYNEV